MSATFISAVIASMVIFLIGLLVTVFYFKKSKYLLILALFVAYGSYALYSVTKGNKDFAHSEANITTTVDAIYSDFDADEALASSKFVIKDMVVQVKGLLKEVVVEADSTTTLVLEGSSVPEATVSIALESKNPNLASSLAIGSEITVNGQCTGILDDFISKKVQLIRGGVVN